MMNYKDDKLIEMTKPIDHLDLGEVFFHETGFKPFTYLFNLQTLQPILFDDQLK